MAVEARYFLGGRDLSTRFADFVPQEMKYVAIIAACPSVDRNRNDETPKRQAAENRAQARWMQCFRGFKATVKGQI